MKRLLVFLFAVITAAHASADHFFAAVDVYGDKWEVVFPFQGVRYQIKIDGVARGTSGYGQRLVLENGEKLLLAEKHSTVEVTRREEVEPPGINLVRTSRNPQSGNEEIETQVEGVHHATTSLKNELEVAQQEYEKRQKQFYREAEEAALRNERFKKALESTDPVWAFTSGEEFGRELSAAVVRLIEEKDDLTKRLERLEHREAKPKPENKP